METNEHFIVGFTVLVVHTRGRRPVTPRDPPIFNRCEISMEVSGYLSTPLATSTPFTAPQTFTPEIAPPITQRLYSDSLHPVLNNKGKS